MESIITRISVNIPDELLTELDDIVKKGRYGNRSEAIREAIRDLIQDIKKRK